MTDSEKLAAIAAIFESKSEEFVDGHRVTKSTHAALNLEGALYDIERHNRYCDVVSWKTLQRVAEQITRISLILNADQEQPF